MNTDTVVPKGGKSQFQENRKPYSFFMPIVADRFCIVTFKTIPDAGLGSGAVLTQ